MGNDPSTAVKSNLRPLGLLKILVIQRWRLLILMELSVGSRETGGGASGEETFFFLIQSIETRGRNV